MDTFIGVKFSNTVELETNEIGNIVRGSVYSDLPDDKFHTFCKKLIHFMSFL